MDVKKEYILCSAIKRKEPRKGLEGMYHQNDLPGIELGYRHHDIMRRFPTELNQREQGFYTSKGRYVDRNEGAKIALECGQITKLSYGKQLYSEDLY